MSAYVSHGFHLSESELINIFKGKGDALVSSMWLPPRFKVIGSHYESFGKGVREPAKGCGRY